MTGFFRRQNKVVTILALAAWIFANFVGVANACGWDDSDALSDSVIAASTVGNPVHDGEQDGCEQFCKVDVPVVTKLPPVGDQPDLQPLIVSGSALQVVAPSLPAFQLARAAHPPSDVPPFLRFTRLLL